MKKKFKNFIILFFLIFFYKINAFAIGGCALFFESLKSEMKNMDLGLAASQFRAGPGFVLEEIFDQKQDTFIYARDKNKNLIIGKIYKNSLVNKINIGDKVLQINGEDTSTLEEDEVFEIIEKKGPAQFLISSKEKKINLDLEIKEEMPITSNFILNIRNLKINEKENTFTATLDSSFVFEYGEESGQYKLAQEHLIYEKDDGSGFLDFDQCNIDRKKWDQFNNAYPDNVYFPNLVSLDKSKIEENVSYYLFLKESEYKYAFNGIDVTATTTGEMTFKNSYDLRNFPFDKQKIKIEIINIGSIEDTKLAVSEYSARNLLQFKEENSIQGWNFVDSKIRYEPYQNPNNIIGEHNQKLNIEIEVERKVGYYIFKIIFPISLILLVCWSAIWITPREIESRLTITIVCLLSLIAYNFVIDNDLPKLEYLTVMDYMILLSYVYAAIPNFLSVYSHNFYRKFRKKVNIFENYGKKYGFLSYIVSVLILIFINVNFSPNNAALFSWMSLR